MEYGAGSVPTAPEVAQDGNKDTIGSTRGVRGWPEGAAYRPPWTPTLFPAVLSLALAFAVIFFPAISVAQTATVTNSQGKITSPARNLASPQTRSPSGTSRQTGSIGSLDVETRNTVDGDLRASEGGVVSIGDVNTSGVSAGKVTVRTKTTLDGGEFSRGGSGEVGVVGLQDLSAGTVNIESRNELSGKMRSSNNSSVSVGGVNVGSEKKQGHFNDNRNSTGSFTTAPRAGKAASSDMPAGQISSQKEAADNHIAKSSPQTLTPETIQDEEAQLLQEDFDLPELADQHPFEFVESDSDLWAAAFNRMLTKKDQEEMYENLYTMAGEYRALAEVARVRAKIAAEDGDFDLAKQYKEEYFQHQKKFAIMEDAAIDVYNSQLGAAAAKARAVRDISFKASSTLASVALPGAGGVALDLTLNGIKYAVDRNDPDLGKGAAERALVQEVAESVVLSLFSDYTSAGQTIDKDIGDLVGKNDILKALARSPDGEIKDKAMKVSYKILRSGVNDATKEMADNIQAQSERIGLQVAGGILDQIRQAN